MASVLQQLDSQLDQAFASWNIYTTLIAIILIAYLVYPAFFSAEPDVHPLLLARQSSASYVRQPKESAVFRSLETPHGYPLRTGLNVKDTGAPRWSSGRDGDLRHVWRRAVSGPIDNDGKQTGEAGKMLSVMGKEEVVERSLGTLSGEISAVGQHMKGHGGTRVAIYLPNSVELLVALFAATFYGLTPVLIPREQPLDKLAGILAETKADVIVAGAGSLPLNELLHKYSIKQVIWVVERTSRHMDWNEVPEGEGGKADIAVWHDIIDEKVSSLLELPAEIPGGEIPKVVMVTEDAWSALDSYELTEYTQANLVAAISAQISALPRLHRLSPTDLVTPLASLTEIYPLTITLAALHSNASLAITTVSGPKAPYSAAFQAPSVSPTIIIASTETLSRHLKNAERTQSTSPWATFTKWRKTRALEAGIMPKAPTTSSAPRLIYTYTSPANTNPSLSSSDLLKLKILTSARLIYAFTHAQVAGAVAQTNMLDYQTPHSDADQAHHFGPPLGSVEIRLKDMEGYKNGDEQAVGRLVVNGPAVVGGEGVGERVMRVTGTGTLAYV